MLYYIVIIEVKITYNIKLSETSKGRKSSHLEYVHFTEKTYITKSLKFK